MGISEVKKKIVIDNYFKSECDVNTSIKEAFTKGFEVGLKKALTTSQPKTGRWMYDKNIENWRCSECGETPKTIGYCGTADFMAEHFKYCNHCGAKMEEMEKNG